MGTATDAQGRITDSSHRTRQLNAMRKAGERFASEAARNEAAFALLARWQHEARHGRSFAELDEETTELLVAAHNNARNGQGVTK